MADASELRVPDETGVVRAQRRLASLKNARQPFESHWREIADHTSPRRQRWVMEDARKDQRSNRIINGTPVLALRTLRSGMMAGLTSPARPWFRLSTPDSQLAEFGPVKDWLHQVAQLMRDMFSRTNLYSALPSVYGDQGAFGTTAMFALEDDESVLRFSTQPIGSYWIAVDEKGRVDTIYRSIAMTVRQMAQKFGADKLSARAKAAIRGGGLETLIEVLHVIEKNEDYDPTLFMSLRGKKWRSCYYEVGSGTDSQATLLEEGFRDFPAMCPRWDITATEEAYGSSPGMEALGDCKSLQLQEKRKAQAIDKHVDPPMRAAVALKNQKASLLPGDVTYVDSPVGSGHGFEPVYEIKPDIQWLSADIRTMEDRIRRAYFEDLFLMISMGDQRDMTATEIAERHEEKLLALGPVLERQNIDLLDPIIDIAFNTMGRRGLLPQPPKELAGTTLTVKYTSILAQAQRAVATGSLERFASFVGQLAQAKPEVLDKMDGDQMVDEYGDSIGVPPRVVVPDDQVAEMRAARAQQQQMKDMAAMADPLKKGVQAAALANETVPAPGNIAEQFSQAMANAGAQNLPQ